MAKRSFDELVQLMQTLRGPDGCPWDRKQTLPSLKPFVIEESYEVIDAIEARRPEIPVLDLGFQLMVRESSTMQDT